MFGGSNTFGSGGGFGNTSGFGGNSNTGGFGNTGFGGNQTFGAGNKSSFGGGGFGQTQNSFSLGGTSTTPSTPFQSSGSSFGNPQQQQTSGFGGGGAPFGGTSNFSTPFGNKPATNTGFGQTSGGFGQTGGFGQQSQTGTFGANNAVGGFGGASGTVTGTSNPRYQATYDRTAQGNFQSITAMTSYKSKSFEELRLEDYSIGRKPGQSGQNTGGGLLSSPGSSFLGGNTGTTGGFGANQTTGFGSSGFGSTTPSTGFGTTGGFGQQQQKPGGFGTSTTGGFGTGTTGGFGTGNTGGFGASTSGGFGTGTTGGFGTSTTGGFGTGNTGGFGTSTTGGFGTGNTGGFGASTTGGFGASTTGGFGASTTGGFGTTPSTGFGSTGGFGQQQPKPSGFGSSGTSGFGTGFGTTGGGFSTPSKPGGFGASTTGGFGTTPSTGFGTTGGFGQQQQKPGGFGASTTGGFGTTPSTGFGTSSFGQQQKPGGFGGGTTSGFGTTPSTGFGASSFGTPAKTGFGATTTGGFGFSTPSTGFSTASGSGFGSFSTPSGFGAPQQTPAASLAHVMASPYGSSSLFQSKKDIAKKVGTGVEKLDVDDDEKTRESKLRSSEASVRSRISKYTTAPRTTGKIKPRGYGESSRHTSRFTSKSLLFDDRMSETILVPHKRSIKKLVIQPEEPPSSTDSKLSKSSDFTQDSRILNGKIIPNPFDETSVSIKPVFDAEAEQKTVSVVPETLNVSAISPVKKEKKYDEVPILNIEDQEHSPIGSVQSPQSDLCPILTNPDFYTRPSMDILYNMNDEELSSVVDFQVGCKDIGSVHFLGYTDVRGLNLDEIIEFEPKAVVVYPDESIKPPLGQGLNKPSIITLENCYPYDDRTVDIQKNQQKINKYIEKIEKTTKKLDAKLIEYNPETGIWTFRVDHFSKYGLDDDDENDENDEFDDDDNDYKEQKDKKTEQNNENYLNNEEISYQKNYIEPKPAHSHLARNIYAASPMKHIDNLKFQRMKNSFFAEDSSENSPEQSFFEIPSLKDSSFTEGIPEYEVQMTSETDYVTPKRKISIEKREVPTTSESLVFENSDCWVDSGLFMGRYFRVSWSSDGTIYAPNFRITPSNSHVFNVTKIKTKPLKTVGELTNCLNDRLKVSYISKDLDVVVKKEDITPLIRTFCSNINNDSFQYSVLSLVLCLWNDGIVDKSSNLSDKQLHLANLNRKKELSSWLRDQLSNRKSKRSTLSSIDSDSNDDIFEFLSCNNIEEAVKIAVESKNYHLGTLISCVGQNEFKMNLNQQMLVWGRTGALELMEESLKRIYELLAGNLNRKIVIDGIGNDWIRSFAIHLWYSTNNSGDPISFGLNNYLESVKLGYSPKATIPYDYSSAPVEQKILLQEKLDLRVQLLLLFSNINYDLAKVFDPLTYTLDATDYSLAWILNSIISDLNLYKYDFPDYENYLYDSTASQLEFSSEWIMSIFVLMHIKDKSVRNSAIFSLLMRHGCDLDKNSENILIKQFKLPIEWIYRSKAQYEEYSGNYITQAVLLMKAKQYEEAHNIVMKYIACQSMLSGKNMQLVKLLLVLKNQESLLVDWNRRGGLFLSFYELEVSIRDLKKTFNSSAVMKDLSKLYTIMESCSLVLTHLEEGSQIRIQFENISLMYRSCFSEMYRRIFKSKAELGVLINSLNMIDENDNDTGLVKHIIPGIIPEDEKISLSSYYYSNLIDIIGKE